ncbi:hypothetical protein CBM2585_A130097 [Cupriavidus taiwanensis]|nr:hypothetical protein CBM2585_A130097 [Cupriavidus taiwanensis]
MSGAIPTKDRASSRQASTNPTHSELDGLPSVLQEIMTNHRVRQTARADPMVVEPTAGQHPRPRLTTLHS